MSTLDLQQRLSALRTSPPDTGFERRLHNALLREANVMVAAQHRPVRVLSAPRRWFWGFAIAALAISGSATAMWAVHTLRHEAPPPGAPLQQIPSQALPASKPKPTMHSPVVPPPPDVRAQAEQLAPVVPVVPLPSKTGQTPRPAQTFVEDKSQSSSLTNESLDSDSVEPPVPELRRLDIPRELPARNLAQHERTVAATRTRPELHLPEHASGKSVERKETATKRREQRRERSRRNSAEKAERGLERAREAQQQHVRQR